MNAREAEEAETCLRKKSLCVIKRDGTGHVDEHANLAFVFHFCAKATRSDVVDTVAIVRLRVVWTFEVPWEAPLQSVIKPRLIAAFFRYLLSF